MSPEYGTLYVAIVTSSIVYHHLLACVSRCALVGLCVTVCTCWLVCHGVHLLACVSRCALVGLCVTVCTCWLVCHGVHLLACVSRCALVGLCVTVCTCWLVCHGVHLLACVSRCVLVGLCVMVCTCWLVSWCVLVGLCVMVCTCWLTFSPILYLKFNIIMGCHVLVTCGVKVKSHAHVICVLLLSGNLTFCPVRDTTTTADCRSRNLATDIQNSKTKLLHSSNSLLRLPQSFVFKSTVVLEIRFYCCKISLQSAVM